MTGRDDEFEGNDVLPEGPDSFGDADLDALYRAQPVARPPADFADRVVPRARWRRLRWVTAGTALAAAAAALALWIGPGAPRTGAVDARDLTTAALVDRATAVADPGARIRWAMVDDLLEVQQTRGRVFYRVDEGPLSVRTPAGDVSVTGTCFSVEVSNMSPTVKAAALGALVGVAATVVVYEGAVRVSSAHGELELGPGERGVTRSEAAPTRLDPRPAEPAIAGQPPQPPPRPVVEAVDPGLVDELREQIRREVEAGLRDGLTEARDELRRVTRELEAERAMRAESEGAPMAFPADLPERFTEDTLRARFQQAMTQADIAGEMVSIDCSEYPCILYADLENSEKGDHEKLFETDALAPYTDDGKNVSVWGRRTKGEDGVEQTSNFVGLAMMPKGELSRDERAALGKRLQFRNQQAFEAFAPEMHDEEATPE